MTWDPSQGVKILEIAGIGPGPFAAMMLADMGADVIRVDRAQSASSAAIRPARRPTCSTAAGARSAIDLKNPDGVEALLDARRVRPTRSSRASGPACASGSGFGPDVCLARNPRLVFGRMTGWGQDGPLRPGRRPRHQLHRARRRARADRSGRREARCRRSTWSATSAAAACCSPSAWCARCSRRKSSGEGQVVDAAMVDGAAVADDDVPRVQRHGHLERRARHQPARHRRPLLRRLRDRRRQVRVDRLDRAAVLRRAARASPGSTPTSRLPQPAWIKRRSGPTSRSGSTAIFKTKTRDEWCEIMEHTDVCFAPVLSLSEAPQHPHNVERGTFVERNGVVQPAPAPRFSRTPARSSARPSFAGQHTDEALADWGFDADRHRQAARDRRHRLSPTSAGTRARTPGVAGRLPGVATLVCFHAHPDDETIATGGTMAKAAADGHRVVLVIATRGEQGEPVPGRARRRRAALAAAGAGAAPLGRDPRASSGSSSSATWTPG